MIPPRSFPPGIIKLVEVGEEGKQTTLSELPNSPGNLMRTQQMKNDLLMTNPRLNLSIRENNS